jgi:hypothetical protein
VGQELEQFRRWWFAVTRDCLKRTWQAGNYKSWGSCLCIYILRFWQISRRGGLGEGMYVASSGRFQD